MARFFIDRPVFAIVIAIVIVILGSVAIPNLPIETYPQVVPPVVQIIAAYRGVFPTLMRDASEMSADLRSHVRYP